MASKQCGYRASIALIVFGLVCVGMAFWSSQHILYKLHQGVRDQLVIDSLAQDAKKYDDWVSTTDPDDVAKYWKVYFYNLTNLDSVGEKVSLEQVGPYVYREYETRFDVKFSEDHTSVAFKDFSNYTFVPEMSSGSLDDNITSLNVGLLGAIAEAGSIETLASVMADKYVEAGVKPLAVIKCFGKPISTDCHKLAAKQWGTLDGVPSLGLPPNKSWTTDKNLVSLVGDVQPLVARVLNTMTGLDRFGEFAAFSKFNSRKNIKFTPQQAYDVLYNHSVALCPLRATFNTPLGVQPCSAVVLQEYEQKGAPFVRAFFYQNHVSLEQLEELVDYLRWIGNGMISLTAEWNGAQDAKNKPAWIPRTPNEWLWHNVDQLLVLANQSNPSSALFGKNYSSPADALRHGDVGVDKVLTGQKDVSEVFQWTQWNNLTKLEQKRGAVNSKQGFWCNGDVAVSGHDDTQMTPGTNGFFSYKPGMSKSDTPYVWVDQLYRPVPWQYVKDIDVQGIPTWRWRIADIGFEPSPLYSQEYFGLVNLTCPRGGLPLMITPPHMQEVRDLPAEWMVDVDQSKDRDRYTSYLDVEPLTGLTLRGYKRLQLNFLLDKDFVSPPADGAKNAGGQSTKKLVPLAWIEVSSELSPSKADKFKNSVMAAIRARTIMFWSLLLGGLVITIVSIICCRRQKAALDEEEAVEGHHYAAAVQHPPQTQTEQSRARLLEHPV